MDNAQKEQKKIKCNKDTHQGKLIICISNQYINDEEIFYCWDCLAGKEQVICQNFCNIQDDSDQIKEQNIKQINERQIQIHFTKTNISNNLFHINRLISTMEDIQQDNSDQNKTLTYLSEQLMIETVQQIQSDQIKGREQKKKEYNDLILEFKNQQQKQTNIIKQLTDKQNKDINTLNQIKSMIEKIFNDQKDNSFNYIEENRINDQSDIEQTTNKSQQNIQQQRVDQQSQSHRDIDHQSIQQQTNAYTKKLIEDLVKHHSFIELEGQKLEIKSQPEIRKVLQSFQQNMRQDFFNEFENFLIQTYPLLQQLESLKTDENLFQYQQSPIDSSSSALYNEDEIPRIQERRIPEGYINILDQITLISEDIINQNQNQNLEEIQNQEQNQLIQNNNSQFQCPCVQIEKCNQNQQIVWLNINEGQKEIVSDRNLEYDKEYIFIFQIENKYNYQNQFQLGLTKNNNLDTAFPSNNGLCCLFNINNQGCEYQAGSGIDKIVKGDPHQFQQITQFEMKVFIKKQLLQISDLPDNNVILQIDDLHKDKLNDNEQLRLNFSIAKPNLKIILSHAFSKQQQN